MANVTDPLARSVHGKDPQNLIEYITRQKYMIHSIGKKSALVYLHPMLPQRPQV